LIFFEISGSLLLCTDLGEKSPIIIKNRKFQRKKCLRHFLRYCQATGNYTHNRLNRVNYLTALIKSPQIKVSHSIEKTPDFRVCGNTGFFIHHFNRGGILE